LFVPVDPFSRRAHSWLWGRLPRVELDSIFPGIEGTDVQLIRAFSRSPGTSLELPEITNLVAMAKFIQARNVLEIGTFDGNTALNLAANTPHDTVVTTVDLPPTWDGNLQLSVPGWYVNVTNRATIGWQFQGSPYEKRIQQVFGDSAKLDWGTLSPSRFDLVFIDGCHRYLYVQSDTNNAVKHLKPGGLIVWHDYGYFKDVSDFVDRIADRFRVCVLSGTRLAIGFPDDRLPREE
jgi:predicted O-methyltransferase YrrM